MGTKRQYSGTIDAAFVQITNADYAPFRRVYYSNSKGSISDKYILEAYTYLYDTFVGETLYKSGSTTYLTSGKVKSRSATAKFTSGYTFKDMWSTTYNSAGGDSGGAVFETGVPCIAGIHKGSGSVSFAIKWDHITEKWDLYEY